MTKTTEKSSEDEEATANLVEPLLPSNSEEEGLVIAVEDIERVTLDQELLVDESNWEHGEAQTPGCRNSFFAILFLIQFGVVVSLSVSGIASMGSFESDHFELHKALLFMIALMGSVVGVSAAIMLLLLGPLAEMMIQVSLVLSPLVCGLSSILSLAFANVIGAICLAITSLFGVLYAVHVWHRIPFAVANIATAMEAVKENKGLLPLAYFFTFCAVGWTLLWAFSVVKVFEEPGWIKECSTKDDTDSDCHLSPKGKTILVALLLSLYWTAQVIKNIFHTTIAGVVGTWWFTPQEERAVGCCNTAVFDAWLRSNVYSFGSICLGSLMVAVLQVSQFLVRMARQRRDESGNRIGQSSLLLCLLQFFVDQLERLMEYINSWAFVYVGLYGYEYWTASSKVYQLFQARGWSLILNDHLVGRSLALMQLLIGVVCSGIGIVLGLVFVGSPVAGLLLGFVLGIALSGILFQVVTSAVDTVVVCFAEAPNMLRANHPPELSDRMITAWRAAYPNECGF